MEIKIFKSIDEFIDSIKGKDLDNKKTKKNLEKTLDRAYDIRKLELDLYWKRATYFWGFMIATFAAYFIVIDSTKHISNRYQFLIICIGFIFSLSWYLVNRGSAYWLTHWERIIDAIEEYLGTGLYKINLQETKPFQMDRYYPHSVSRINILVSLTICIVWLGLILNFLYENYLNRRIDNGCLCDKIDWKILILLVATCLAALRLLFYTKSKKNAEYYFYKRDTKYIVK